VIANPGDYEARANIMWCATQALNGLIACGVPTDWATHMIGHELTAFYGIDHAQSLAVVMPALLRYKRAQKCDKLVQYAERVWGIRDGVSEMRADVAIDMTVAFFRSVGVPTSLRDYGIGPNAANMVSERFAERGTKLGEHKDILANDVEQILKLC
jgi:NADP-dependent alcohol dehydrogenase